LELSIFPGLCVANLLRNCTSIHRRDAIQSQSALTRKRAGKEALTHPILPSCFVFPCVLAISRQSIWQRAQAKEAEAEKLGLSLRYLDGSSFRSFLSVFTPGTA